MGHAPVPGKLRVVLNRGRSTQTLEDQHDDSRGLESSSEMLSIGKLAMQM